MKKSYLVILICLLMLNKYESSSQVAPPNLNVTYFSSDTAGFKSLWGGNILYSKEGEIVIGIITNDQTPALLKYSNSLEFLWFKYKPEEIRGGETYVYNFTQSLTSFEDTGEIYKFSTTMYNNVTINNPYEITNSFYVHKDFEGITEQLPKADSNRMLIWPKARKKNKKGGYYYLSVYLGDINKHTDNHTFLMYETNKNDLIVKEFVPDSVEIKFPESSSLGARDMCFNSEEDCYILAGELFSYLHSGEGYYYIHIYDKNFKVKRLMKVLSSDFGIDSKFQFTPTWIKNLKNYIYVTGSIDNGFGSANRKGFLARHDLQGNLINYVIFDDITTPNNIKILEGNQVALVGESRTKDFFVSILNEDLSEKEVYIWGGEQSERIADIIKHEDKFYATGRIGDDVYLASFNSTKTNLEKDDKTSNLGLIQYDNSTSVIRYVGSDESYIKVYNINGEQLFECSSSELGKYSLSSYSTGVYLVETSNGSEKKIEKIIKY